MELYYDAKGTDRMTERTPPLRLLGNGKGRIQFNFIPPAKSRATELADLVIIGQYRKLGDRKNAPRKKDTPFTHLPPFSILEKVYYPAYYLPQPKQATGVVRGGKLGVKKVAQITGPYKYTIVALCENATEVTELDPGVIIHPH
jgi:hypothetical protein